MDYDKHLLTNAALSARPTVQIVLILASFPLAAEILLVVRELLTAGSERCIIFPGP